MDVTKKRSICLVELGVGVLFGIHEAKWKRHAGAGVLHVSVQHVTAGVAEDVSSCTRAVSELVKHVEG